MERIIIDMDEVIADTMGEMVEWYKREHGGDVDYGKMLVGAWIKGFPEQHQAMVWERLTSPGFFRHLPVMKDSVEVIRELNSRYEVFIVSAATEFPNSLKDKMDWLADHFSFLSWRQLVLCGDKKVIQGDYMIDDHVRNLVTFSGQKLLYTTAHNLNETGYERINNWQEVADKFL